MSIQTSFPEMDPKFYKHFGHRENRDKDTTAMGWASYLVLSMGRCKGQGITYSQGSWGYTVLRTVYSDEADGLWQIAMEKLQRWVTDYFIHENRLISSKPDASVNEELAGRFALEVVEDKETLNFPNLSEASQEDIGSLTQAFETWRRKALGDVEFDLRDSPRFCDFLVIDEGALRSIAGLPNETPSLELVSRAERRARYQLFEFTYVWLVDSLAVLRYQGIDDADNYNGLMKLNPSDISTAWFEKVTRFSSEFWTFDRSEHSDGSGDKWYQRR